MSEWLDLMLDEIERKRQEENAAIEEARRRESGENAKRDEPQEK